MNTGTLEKVSLAVQIDGVGYYVALPQDRLVILVKLAEGLTDDGQITLQLMPAGQSLVEVRP